MIEATGLCSFGGVVKVRQGEVPIPYEVVAHMGVEVGVGRLGGVIDMVGRSGEDHSLRLQGDSQGHIVLKYLVVWLEGWVATHTKVGMVVHELRAGKGQWGEE
jgi:hypothetical protein